MNISIVRQARETLAQALAASQEAGPSAEADALAAQIAQAVGALFSLEQDGGGSKQAQRVAKAIAALSEIAAVLPRTRLPSAVRKKIDQAAGEARALLETAVRAESKKRPAARPIPPTTPAATPRHTATPAPRDRLSTPAPVRMSSSGATIETDVGFMTETNFYVGFAGDLSDGGLFVSTWQTLPVGSPVTVNFTLPDGHKARATGQVIWTREADETAPDATPGIGVTLEGLNETDMKSVNSFMSKRAPIFHPG